MIKKNIEKIDKNTYFYKYDSVSYVVCYSFRYETNRLNYMLATLLGRYLTEVSNKYTSKKEIMDKSMELYNASVHISDYSCKGYSTMDAYLRIIDPKKVKEDYLDDAIDYFYELVCNPFIRDNKLDQETFNRLKNKMYNDYVNSSKDMHFEHYKEYCSTVLTDSILNFNIFKDMKELKELIDSITDKDIIDFYYKLINNNYKAILFGNMSNTDVKKITSKFNFNKSNYKLDYTDYINIKKEYNEYVNKNFSQSMLNITYNVDNKYNNRVYASILDIMCNSTDGMLMIILRGKYGLVYHASVCLDFRLKSFHIDADIDKKNKDKTIDAIKEFIDDMHDKKKVEEKLKFAKEKIKENIYLSEESSYAEYNKVFDVVYEKEMTDRELLSKVNKVTVKDIIDFMDTLTNENIFFYIGDKDE